MIALRLFLKFLNRNSSKVLFMLWYIHHSIQFWCRFRWYIFCCYMFWTYRVFNVKLSQNLNIFWIYFILSLLLTKDATAIPTKDNTVFIGLNDGCQDATRADPNDIDLSVTKPKDSGNTKPNPTSNHSFVSLELFNTFYDDYIEYKLTMSYKISVQIKN